MSLTSALLSQITTAWGVGPKAEALKRMAAEGTSGPIGPPGMNAYTATTAPYVQPIVGGAVVVNVGSSAWTVIGQDIYIGLGGGHYVVTAMPNALQVTVQNLGGPGNAAPASVIPAGAGVSPDGLIGPTGPTGPGGALSNNLPLAVGVTSAGAGNESSRWDHVHDHGVQPLGLGTDHDVVTANPGGIAGFMSVADKDKLDGLPNSIWPVSDAIFAVKAAADPTKLLKVDALGQMTGTTATITLGGTVSRLFRLPDISGTALVSEDATGIVFINTTAPAIGSNAGIQYSFAATVLAEANRAQLRCNLFGAFPNGPGVTGFKSRGATIGALAGCIAGDILWHMTAIGVAPNGASIPLAALLTYQVPAGFVPAAQNWLPTEEELQLVPLGGPINGATVVRKTTSEGQGQFLRGSRAGSETAVYATPALAAAAVPTGSLRSSDLGSPEGVLIGSPGDLYSDKTGGVLYVKKTGAATTTGWVLSSAGQSTHLWHLNGDISLSPTDTAAVAPDGGPATFDGTFYVTVPTTLLELRGTVRANASGSPVIAEFLRNRGGLFISLGIVSVPVGNFSTATVAIPAPPDDVLAVGDIVFVRLHTNPVSQDLTLQLTATP